MGVAGAEGTDKILDRRVDGSISDSDVLRRTGVGAHRDARRARISAGRPGERGRDRLERVGRVACTRRESFHVARVVKANDALSCTNARELRPRASHRMRATVSGRKGICAWVFAICRAPRAARTRGSETATENCAGFPSTNLWIKRAILSRQARADGTTRSPSRRTRKRPTSELSIVQGPDLGATLDERLGLRPLFILRDLVQPTPAR